MASPNRSMILYGFEITQLNSSIDFKNASLGPELNATLNFGFYSLQGLADEIVRAMTVADPSVTYTVSIDRSVSGGLENRVTISTNGSYFSLLFGSGSRAASTTAYLIGFNPTDYTGALTYTGSASAGTPIITEWYPFNYLDPDMIEEVQGAVSISASGVKEAIVFQVMEFIQIEFRYEPKTKVKTIWKPFFVWAIQQKPFEITPDFTDYNTVYDVTLERTSRQNMGLGFMWQEMLPNFPNEYQTGQLTLRKKVSNSQFII